MYTNGWDKWGDTYEVQFAPIMNWLCDAVGAAPGKTVLDIACGTGQPALPLARRGAQVIATDADDNMLSATRRRASEAGLTNIDVRSMNMHELHFDDASFDGVTLGFVLMFSPEPVKVMREVRRVLKPGGRVAVAVWDTPDKNPFFTTAFGAVGSVLQQPPPPPDAPGPFRLSPPGALSAVLRDAGFADVEVTPRPIVSTSASPAAHWEMMFDMALKSRVPPHEVERVREALLAAIAPYTDDTGAVKLPMTPLAATGRQPG